MASAAFKASLQQGFNETACRLLIREGSKSFYAASLLLPERVRKPAYALYAFCRLSDDAVDANDAPSDAVERLRERLDLAYRGRPCDIAADRAFAEVIERFEMPRALPEALLDGLEWDAIGWVPQTLSDTYAYSARVASTVGTMMTVLMGNRQPGVLARAADLGVAMQLTNIARDVGEDARNGRTYLPAEWMESAGMDREAFLADPASSAEIEECVAKLLSVADDLYDRALPGIAALPADCRPAIHAARMIYREIGREIARNGYNSVDRRAVVSSRQKIKLLAAAANRSRRAYPGLDRSVLPETQFLVEAVPPLASSSLQQEDGAAKGLARIIEIIQALEQRDRARLPAGSAIN